MSTPHFSDPTAPLDDDDDGDDDDDKLKMKAGETV